MNETYHLRRSDRQLQADDELSRVLLQARYVTVAMCRDNEPYLVTLNHGFDSAEHCLFFHCAAQGKKIDILRANPRVWGIAIEDLGYRDGACDHAYRSVMFSGTVSFLDSDEAKRQALEVMVRQQESDPETVMAKLLQPHRISSVTIGRIDLDQLSGKEGIPAAQ